MDAEMATVADMRAGRWLKVSAVALVAAWAFAVVRAFVVPEPGYFTYHMAYHEHWYPGVMRGDVVDRWLPPGFVLAARFVPGFADVVRLRIVSLASCLALYGIVRSTMGRRKALLLASSPFLVVFGSRAQPDALMVALAFGGMLLARRGNGFLGGVLVGLSAFVKPVGLLVVAAVKPSRGWLAGLAVGLLPFLAWFAFHQDSALLHVGKSVPFEDALRLFIVAPFFLGPSALVPTLRRGWRVNAWALWLAMAFAAFAILKAPVAHEYYLLPAALAWHSAQDAASPRLGWAVALNAGMAALLVWVLGVFPW